LAIDREVLASVELHHQPAFCAVEVDDVRSKRMLAAELQAYELSHP
jgi:hypothetical protein